MPPPTPVRTARRPRFHRPSDLHRVGEEPDYRFSLANERTLLAYVRTALGFMAGGVGLAHFSGRRSDEVTGAVLVVAGTVIAALCYPRWWRVEAAMRQGRPLPYSRLVLVAAVVLTLVGATLLATQLL